MIYSGDNIYLVNLLGSEVYELTATAEVTDSDVTLSIDSYSFTSDIPEGSAVVFDYKTVLKMRG